jgi:hypothetical protein
VGISSKRKDISLQPLLPSITLPHSRMIDLNQGIHFGNIDAALTTIKEKIARYELKDVYNMDETGLFFKLTPSTIISHRQIEGSKKNKICLIIGFIYNIDGSDRLLPLFIGYYTKSHYFNKKSDHELGFYYLHNIKI